MGCQKTFLFVLFAGGWVTAVQCAGAGLVMFGLSATLLRALFSHRPSVLSTSRQPNKTPALARQMRDRRRKKEEISIIGCTGATVTASTTVTTLDGETGTTTVTTLETGTDQQRGGPDPLSAASRDG